MSVGTSLGAPAVFCDDSGRTSPLQIPFSRLAWFYSDASGRGRPTPGNWRKAKRQMAHTIKSAAVIGSGTMGGGIAALLAGCGIETLLLDIPPRDSSPGDGASTRNAIVAANLKALGRARPPQLYSPADLDNIRIGNTEDDFEKVAHADWVIEAVVEKLEVKRALFARLADVVSPEAIISSNTSGLPISSLVTGLPADFSRRFLGTHFFNPPRYLRLLEIIPHAATDSAITDFMLRFGREILGKGTVLCKDKPNFIGNRFMSMSGMQATNYALDHGYTVEEVDLLTGPLIGRPKTATFNLNDLVGFDIAVDVARNLYPAIPEDPARELLMHPGNAALSYALLERGWLGRKTGRGFYHMRREGGRKELWALNLQTLEYDPPSTPRFESVDTYHKVKPLGERIRLLIESSDRGGRYLYHLHAFLLAYASQRVPEITDSIVNVDNAHKWGFNHQLGPFEIWDAIGVAESIVRFEADGYPVAAWVKTMLAEGNATFYARDANGAITSYYCPQRAGYVPLQKDRREITVAGLGNAQVYSNGHGSLYDLGDGALLWAFQTKHNSITPGLVESGWRALELLEHDQYKALVIGNDGERFSIGANLDPSALMDGLAGVEKALANLQELTQALRYAPKPVVVAAHNMALGGGAEIVMAGTAVVAHAELYMGLVEAGVGLVPAGGGCKELLRRLVNPLARNGTEGVLAGLQKAFETIATAKVSGSAKEAMALGFLTEHDKIVMNRAQLLGEAKALALALSEAYEQRKPEPVYAAGRDAYAALLLAVADYQEAGYASEYDAFIARKLARILTGAGLAEAQWVSQQYLLDLEREAFLDLVMQEKTQARILHMLQTNKPLRN
ncbi:MAG: 3-hydroxyacyl-CoA dehydrogenase/enoyl-CoA hydratase family protein [Chloroflexi bacterium]|nr:3-hydroxyacyl-CoA dehydrogenase/enoyl-CoA hydratase family protein [Chloroflexota bacterium]MYC54677.1 3-hydroxyacyl-CoA dehydrogenase/enoyl-CoA hydratase family protein [Chloroflexota bacterium]MYH66100.1 3-hydroxyacyl-CoA dehydrogenase/enoyl-CoA hydratase family protein [Chloroflexota bacterium]